MVGTTGQTSVPGVYAAGDIVDYDGKVKLIATGFGEVATAVGPVKVLLMKPQTFMNESGRAVAEAARFYTRGSTPAYT
jgi:peptidyl-tRNA hydrolase